jgi:hypothetical protein
MDIQIQEDRTTLPLKGAASIPQPSDGLILAD